MRCAVCGRTITDPETLAVGIGPVCRKKHGPDEVFMDLPGPIVLRREGPRVYTNVKRPPALPGAFDWGRPNADAAPLATAILLERLDAAIAAWLIEPLADWLRTLPADGAMVSRADLTAWIAAALERLANDRA